MTLPPPAAPAAPVPDSPDIAAAGAAGAVIESTTARFAADVLEASVKTPVVVDFWAPWCAPCRQLTPLLERLIRAANGGIRMVKINIDDHPDLARQMQIQSIPAVVAFYGGRPVDGFMGALPESQLRQFMDRLLKATTGATPDSGADAAALVFAGEEALAAGDQAGAAQAFGQALQHQPTMPEAIAGLARCYLAAGEIEQARKILSLTPAEAAAHERIRQAQAALTLAEKTSTGTKSAEALETALASAPGDHGVRFDLALALHGAGRHQAAVDQLLLIVEKDPAWNEQAARKQLLELFDAFGPAHTLTIDGRQRLSSLLFR